MELKETTKLMNSNSYKERFIAEYLQLKIRIEKLDTFINKIKVYNMLQAEGIKPPFGEPIHMCPLQLLEAQLDNMKQYLNILEMRALIESIDLTSSELELNDR